MNALTESQLQIAEATRNSDLGSLEALLEANPDALYEWPAATSTPLHDAAGSDDAEICHALINAGMGINSIDEVHQTPIFKAIASFDAVSAKLLVGAGADVSHADIQNDTPLHECARRNFGEIAELLLDHEAAVDVRNDSDQTPLHLAASQASAAFCELLIERGADANAISTAWHTPLWSAAKSGRASVCEALIRKGSSLSGTSEFPSPFLQSCVVEGTTRSAEVMAVFISNGANLHETDLYGIQGARRLNHPGAAHLCVFNDNAPGLELLAKAGLALHDQRCDGMGLLQFAAQENAVEAASKLLDLGLAPDQDCHEMARSSGSQEVLALFQAYEARMTIRRVSGLRSTNSPAA